MFHIRLSLPKTPNQKIADQLKNEPINDILERTVIACNQHANMCTLFLESDNIIGISLGDLLKEDKEMWEDQRILAMFESQACRAFYEKV